MSEERKPRILGIDYGLVRVGLAVSDPLRLTAQPVGTVKASSTDNLISEIETVVTDKRVQKIVVGLPLNMNGSEGPAAEGAREFASMLIDRLNIEVVLWDERLSTVRAERVMLEADLSRKKRAKHRDTIAAQFILQNYLDAENLRTPEPES